MDIKKTGLLISQARKEKELTQKELAQRLHVSDRTVSKWERGAGFPDVTLLEPLSDELGIPLHVLLSGEENRDPESQENILREAVKYACQQCRQRIFQDISRLIASVFLFALTGFMIFAILDYNGAFLKEVSCQIPAVIYKHGKAGEETSVSIDGTIQILGNRNFQGSFQIEAVPVTVQKGVRGYIRWDNIQEGYQDISFYRAGLSHVETGIHPYLYISPDMEQFALTLEDGRIIATNPQLAALQAIEEHRYALDYGGKFYPYFSYHIS